MTVPKANVFPHEEYDVTTIANDIAVIKLVFPLPLSPKISESTLADLSVDYYTLRVETMAAIKLPKSSDAKKGRTYDNEQVLQSGWGITGDSAGRLN
jgi:hypothetical protein